MSEEKRIHLPSGRPRLCPRYNGVTVMRHAAPCQPWIGITGDPGTQRTDTYHTQKCNERVLNLVEPATTVFLAARDSPRDPQADQ
ncbi:hypothetical protein PHLCEN_2v4622 [Hermanssonia centrifuga]|uniref:Uncharacterized protein n=1 Tax=Hermanssonia centrifuga TaxID=98765 RepID=A0A2R6PN30_9APHY|nr:hypothetical protein PHLCEN_2v4622 [Hermanssonia centrifuga]